MDMFAAFDCSNTNILADYTVDRKCKILAYDCLAGPVRENSALSSESQLQSLPAAFELLLQKATRCAEKLDSTPNPRLGVSRGAARLPGCWVSECQATASYAWNLHSHRSSHFELLARGARVSKPAKRKIVSTQA